MPSTPEDPGPSVACMLEAQRRPLRPLLDSHSEGWLRRIDRQRVRVFIRFADSGRRTQAMKREGMREGLLRGVAVPDWDASCGVEAGALRSDRGQYSREYSYAESS
jgi:hypothetical protein